MTIAASPEGVPTAAVTSAAGGSAPTRRLPGIAIAAVSSIGAGAIHAAAAGIHAEHPQLARIFVIAAVLQLGVGLVALTRPSRLAAWGVAVVNAVAVAGWLATRVTGISWIDGLEVREAPQFADTACALLGAVAVGAALAAALVGWRQAHPARFAFPSIVVAAIAVPAMMLGGTHVHSHGDAAGHSHDVTAAGVIDESQPHDHAAAPATGAAGATETTVHDHSSDAPVAAAWPRPWDPTQPIDVSGVAGVTPEQEARATTLIEDTLKDLPKYADPAAAIADGYASIGDGGTGSEHFIKQSLINDDVLLDPNQPESLVYSVKNGARTLAGAMYISSARPADDPTLTNWAGPLMTWHKHDNLCWDTGADGKAKVVGLIDANGNCARGVRAGGENPMVHVWITPHPCGVFAALEGVGAGTAAVSEDQRVDTCNAAHNHGAPAAAAVAPVPYDPSLPIDLSGTPGVTPQQQAAAENLIAVTLVRLPKWSNYKDAEAAGFRSIGDGATGFEHFIQWDWINDDVTMDPDFPESLVYQPQPDGSKKLLSAMYMLPDTVALQDVPDVGGALMQWHIHDNLCFTNDPVQPRVAGVTSSTGSCPAPLVKFRPAPMIHVWITPHKCGPFAALEGVGAGQIVPGEERLCDHNHGSGF